MESFLGALGVISLIALWAVLIVALVVRTINASETNASRAWVLGIVTFLILAIPLAGLLGQMNDETKSLCLRGHQVWASNGKSTYKEWRCDEYER